MTQTHEIDEHLFELLSAYVDGALPPDAATEVERRAAEEPAIAAQLEEIRALNAELAAAFPAPVEDHAPRKLRQIAQHRGRTPIWRFKRPLRRAAPTLGFGLALAAGLALFAVSLTTWTTESAPYPVAEGDVAPQSLLAGLLSETPTGEVRTDGAVRMTPVGTFIDGAGRACREFETERTNETPYFGVACRTGEDWSVEFIVAGEAETAPDGTIRPAAGAPLDEINGFLDQLGAGPFLSPAAEQALIESWR